MTITTPEQEVERDRYGRPLIVPPNGGKAVPYTRCTTFVSCLEDTYNLSRWQQRMVAIGLAESPDLMLQINSVDKEDKKALNGVCESAMERAKAHAAATIGTALHALTERLDRGQELGVIPDAYQADLKAYEAATADMTSVHIEQLTVVDDLRIAGTPDRVVEVNGKRYIADLKTGSISYGIGKIAMQLAVYSRGVGYDFKGARRFDLGPVDQDTGIVIHLPAGSGTCELVEVDLKAGWEAVHLAEQVREWRSRKGLSRTYSLSDLTLPDTAPDTTAAIAEAIATAKTVDELGALWTANQAVWTPDLTELASARKALIAA